jgi:glucosamine-6-phosphate deaminase
MEFTNYGHARVAVASSNEALGERAAERFAEKVRRHLDEAPEIAVILATGNSQLSFIRSVVERPDIDWSRIHVLHMDEYLGMSADHPASFRRWMQENLIRHVTLRSFEGVAGDHEPIEEEMQRYSELLRRLRPSICVMGIGENGHLAFNDPPADFDTDELVQVVQLDEVCRQQQVGEGHFEDISQTPTEAVTLTIPALLAPDDVMVLVPESRKASAVKSALEGPITPDCPASILRESDRVEILLDPDSAALLATWA